VPTGGVLAWWGATYLSGGKATLPRRFTDEARASLPAMDPAEGMPAHYLSTSQR